jgi:hypothetical protein
MRSEDRFAVACYQHAPDNVRYGAPEQNPWNALGCQEEVAAPNLRDFAEQ